MITAKLYGNPRILPVWQPIGHSTYQIANQVAKHYNTKVAHTGVLDPLAEGVVIMLLGEERLKKLDHTNWLKEYEFEISFGVSTDSCDGMGIFESLEISDSHLTRDQIHQIVTGLIGEYSQKVPVYSAQKVRGLKLFMYPKLGLEPPEIPIKSGHIHTLELVDVESVYLKDKVNDAISKIRKIKSGEFRQDEIISKWEEFLAVCGDARIQTAKLRVVMTRGLYVRALCKDICDKLGVLGFVSNLTRTKNGKYNQKNSSTLEKIFGDKYDPQHFRSRYVKLV